MGDLSILYRAYCDHCGENVTPRARLLGNARNYARAHAVAFQHDTRIEPEHSFALVEMVYAQRPWK